MNYLIPCKLETLAFKLAVWWLELPHKRIRQGFIRPQVKNLAMRLFNLDDTITYNDDLWRFLDTQDDIRYAVEGSINGYSHNRYFRVEINGSYKRDFLTDSEQWLLTTVWDMANKRVMAQRQYETNRDIVLEDKMGEQELNGDV